MAKPGPAPRTLTARQRRSLEAAARRLAKAESRSGELRAELVHRIIDVHADGAGASMREIARAVGLSSARVGELILRRKAEA
jgi:hypothetical protein